MKSLLDADLRLCGKHPFSFNIPYSVLTTHVCYSGGALPAKQQCSLLNCIHKNLLFFFLFIIFAPALLICKIFDSLAFSVAAFNAISMTFNNPKSIITKQHTHTQKIFLV